MLNHFHTYKQKSIDMFLIFTILSIVGCVSPVPPDSATEGIFLEEAQELLPFQICLPEYVPIEINIAETVRYHDEFGDPNESDITIDYFDINKENPIFTIYERHGPSGVFDFHDNTIQRVNLRQLMDWQIDTKNIEDFEKQVDELDKQGIVKYQIYTFNSERLIVEIKSPEELKSVLVTWQLSESVLIDIYSHLSTEETKLIANSVDCN